MAVRRGLRAGPLDGTFAGGEPNNVASRRPSERSRVQMRHDLVTARRAQDAWTRSRWPRRRRCCQGVMRREGASSRQGRAEAATMMRATPLPLTQRRSRVGHGPRRGRQELARCRTQPRARRRQLVCARGHKLVLPRAGGRHGARRTARPEGREGRGGERARPRAQALRGSQVELKRDAGIRRARRPRQLQSRAGTVAFR